MVKIPRFSIFYTNGEQVDGGGEDDELVPIYVSRKWLEAPNDGVSHIVCETPDIGRNTVHSFEFYYQMPINFHGKGDIGGSMKIGPFLRQLTDIGGLVKFGGWTHNDSFKIAARAAHLSTHVPPRSGQRREPLEDASD